MIYEYYIEVVQGGFILTHSEPNYGRSGIALQTGSPIQTRYVFQNLDDLLDFLRQKLK